MTDAVTIELIRAAAVVPSTVGAIAAGWFSYKAATHSKEAAETSKITQSQSNGMKDALVALTAKSSKAIGNLQGRADLTAELAEQTAVEHSISTEATYRGEANQK